MDNSDLPRRAYLGAIVAALTSVAGCSSSDTEAPAPTPTDSPSEPSPTATPSSTQTSTATPSPPDFEVLDVSAPDAVNLRENYQIVVEVANRGGEAGAYHGVLEISESTRPEPSWWESRDIELWVPAGETRTWRSSLSNRVNPGIVFYRLDGGQSRSIHIPEGKNPIIESTNLVSEWNSFGDAVDNSIEEISVGEVVNIASRYWFWHENQTYDAFIQIEIYDGSFNRVAIRTDTSEQLTDYSGWSRWEWSFGFSSNDWDPGTYSAEMLIRDNQSEEVSDIGTVEFDVVQDSATEPP